MSDVARTQDPLGPAVWFLVAQAGHGGCAGWRFDRRNGLLRCVCGAALYEFHEPVRPHDGTSGSSVGRTRQVALA